PPQAACSGAFRPGPEDFVLDSEDAVRGGAVLLDSAQVPSAEACQRACCERARCNLALLELRGRDAAGARNHTCVLFNCIHRNRFVCRFANQDGFRSFISNSASLRHLQGPTGGGGQAPPIADAGPDLVVQPGTVVLLNGIESVPLGGAHITAYRWTLLRGNDSVSMEPTDLPDQVSVSGLQAGSYTFQLTVTDSKQQSDAANVSVLVLSPQLSSTFCRAPVKVGPCRAAFPRWWFNASTGQCQPFTFGGCKGNSNNYLTEEDCVSACRGVAACVCVCVFRGVWSLCSPSQLSCGSGCCLHKSLECDGVKHCSDGSDENHCSELNQTFSHLLEIEVDKKKARCSEPPYTGPCRASFPRWYYNPMDMRCVRFTSAAVAPTATTLRRNPGVKAAAAALQSRASTSEACLTVWRTTKEASQVTSRWPFFWLWPSWLCWPSSPSASSSPGGGATGGPRLQAPPTWCCQNKTLLFTTAPPNPCDISTRKHQLPAAAH
ncbi:unnamed protein product, partial [Tetraodon nigroviridis]